MVWLESFVAIYDVLTIKKKQPKEYAMLCAENDLMD